MCQMFDMVQYFTQINYFLFHIYSYENMIFCAKDDASIINATMTKIIMGC